MENASSLNKQATEAARVYQDRLLGVVLGKSRQSRRHKPWAGKPSDL